MKKEKLLDIVDERLKLVEYQREIWERVNDGDDCKGLVLKALNGHHLDLT